MMKKTLPLLLCLFVSSLLFAQEKDSSPLPNQQLYEVGLDFKNVLTKTLVSSVIFKRRIKKLTSEDGREAQYWRLQVSWRGDFSNARDSSELLVGSRTVTSFNDQDFNWGLSIGREWVKQQGDRFSVYGGAEIFGGFQYFDRTRPNLSGSATINIGDNVRFTWNSGDRILSQELRLGVTPFFGAKFHLSRRFFIAAESSLDLYYKSDLVKINSTPLSQVEFEEVQIKTEGFGSFFSPLNLLILGYSF